MSRDFKVVFAPALLLFSLLAYATVLGFAVHHVRPFPPHRSWLYVTFAAQRLVAAAVCATPFGILIALLYQRAAHWVLLMMAALAGAFALFSDFKASHGARPLIARVLAYDVLVYTVLLMTVGGVARRFSQRSNARWGV